MTTTQNFAMECDGNHIISSPPLAPQPPLPPRQLNNAYTEAHRADRRERYSDIPLDHDHRGFLASDARLPEDDPERQSYAHYEPELCAYYPRALGHPYLYPYPYPSTGLDPWRYGYYDLGLFMYPPNQWPIPVPTQAPIAINFAPAVASTTARMKLSPPQPLDFAQQHARMHSVTDVLAAQNSLSRNDDILTPSPENIADKQEEFSRQHPQSSRNNRAQHPFRRDLYRSPADTGGHLPLRDVGADFPSHPTAARPGARETRSQIALDGLTAPPRRSPGRTLPLKASVTQNLRNSSRGSPLFHHCGRHPTDPFTVDGGKWSAEYTVRDELDYIKDTRPRSSTRPLEMTPRPSDAYERTRLLHYYPVDGLYGVGRANHYQTWQSTVYPTTGTEDRPHQYGNPSSDQPSAPKGTTKTEPPFWDTTSRSLLRASQQNVPISTPMLQLGLEGFYSQQDLDNLFIIWKTNYERGLDHRQTLSKEHYGREIDRVAQDAQGRPVPPPATEIGMDTATDAPMNTARNAVMNDSENGNDGSSPGTQPTWRQKGKWKSSDSQQQQFQDPKTDGRQQRRVDVDTSKERSQEMDEADLTAHDLRLAPCTDERRESRAVHGDEADDMEDTIINEGQDYGNDEHDDRMQSIGRKRTGDGTAEGTESSASGDDHASDAHSNARRERTYKDSGTRAAAAAAADAEVEAAEATTVGQRSSIPPHLNQLSSNSTSRYQKVSDKRAVMDTDATKKNERGRDAAEAANAAPAKKRRIRTGESRNHCCEYCDKRFSRPSQLAIHMYTHSGETSRSASRCRNKKPSPKKKAIVPGTDISRTGSTGNGSTGSGGTGSGGTGSGSTDSGSTGSGSTSNGSTGSGSTSNGSTGNGSSSSTSGSNNGGPSSSSSNTVVSSSSADTPVPTVPPPPPVAFLRRGRGDKSQQTDTKAAADKYQNST
ncbi:hypothetical protein BG004_001050 [Podila humilis]|nr:hypothetical protein BG004_001050 [Podila humilis]